MTSTEYAKGYMAGLADAQKQAVSSLTGNPLAKKVWIACPACGKQSPIADPEAELLKALQPFVLANSSEEFVTLVVRSSDITKARAAIAKATGGAS